jgi:hypothetical protein
MKFLTILLLGLIYYSYGQTIISQPYLFQKYITVKDSAAISGRLRIPIDTTMNKYGIAQIGSSLFVGNGTNWATVTGGGTSDSSYFFKNGGNNFGSGVISMGTNNNRSLNFKTNGRINWIIDSNYSFANSATYLPYYINFDQSGSGWLGTRISAPIINSSTHIFFPNDTLKNATNILTSSNYLISGKNNKFYAYPSTGKFQKIIVDGDSGTYFITPTTASQYATASSVNSALSLKLNNFNFIDSLTGRNATLLGNTTTGTGSTIVLSGSPTLTLPNISAVNVSGGILSFPTGGSGTVALRGDTITRFTGLASLGKAYNDSLTLATAINTKGAGTITGVITGTNITGGGTSGTVTINADTTTGSTKLATQGFVIRNAYTLPSTVTLNTDTIALASFGAGSAATGDTAAFTTTAVYGSFFNSGTDTLVITRMQIGLQGTSPSINTTVWVNDTLAAATTGGFKLVTAGTTATNIYGGTSVTSFDNTKIPPNVWVWVQTPTVTTKPTYFTLTLIGYKKRV